MATPDCLTVAPWRWSSLAGLFLAFVGLDCSGHAQIISEEPVLLPKPPVLSVSLPEVQELLNLGLPKPPLPAPVVLPSSGLALAVPDAGVTTTQVLAVNRSAETVPPAVPHRFVLPEQVQALVERNGTVFPPEAE